MAPLFARLKSPTYNLKLPTYTLPSKAGQTPASPDPIDCLLFRPHPLKMEDYRNLSTIKVFFRYIQTYHHDLALTKSPPKGLLKIRSRLDRSLRPAIPNTHIKRIQSKINQDWTVLQIKAMSQHYRIQQDLAISTLRARQPITASEFEEQWTHSMKWANKALGNKLQAHTLEMAKETCWKASVANRVRPCTDARATAPTRPVTHSGQTYAQAVASTMPVKKSGQTPVPLVRLQTGSNRNNGWTTVTGRKAARPSTPPPQSSPAGVRAVAGRFDPLSNFFGYTHKKAGRVHHSVEQVYQMTKASHFGHRGAFEKIGRTRSATQAKSTSDEFFKSKKHDLMMKSHPRIGQLDRDWHVTRKRQVVRSLLKEKVHQCPPFRKALMASGNCVIRHNTTDRFWGTGSNDPTLEAGGSNAFGNLLMEVRRDLVGPTAQGSRFRQLQSVSEGSSTPQPGPSTSVAPAEPAPKKHQKQGRSMPGNPTVSTRVTEDEPVPTGPDSREDNPDHSGPPSRVVTAESSQIEGTPSGTRKRRRSTLGDCSVSKRSTGGVLLPPGQVEVGGSARVGNPATPGPPRHHRALELPSRSRQADAENPARAVMSLDDHVPASELPAEIPHPKNSLAPSEPQPGTSSEGSLMDLNVSSEDHDIWTEANSVLPSSPTPPPTRRSALTIGDFVQSQPNVRRSLSVRLTPLKSQPAPAHRVPIKPIKFKAINNSKKDEWTLPPGKFPKILIVGDSLINRISNINDMAANQTKIISYAGATFRHILGIIRSEKTVHHSVRHLILSVGINSHAQNAEKTANKYIREIFLNAKSVFPSAKIYFTKFVQDLPNPGHMKNLRDFEATFQKQCRGHSKVLNPCLRPTFEQDNYHWDSKTADNMVGSWLDQLNLN